jgi:hypothetical protein
MTPLRVTAGLVALGIVMATGGAETQDKPFVRVTQEQGMAALKTAAESAKGNYASLENTFQREIRKIWNDYDNALFKVYDRAEMNVLIIGPAENAVSNASAALKRGETIDGVTWPGGVTVYIAVLSNDSPDIVDVVVERDGKVIEPLHKGLQPRPIQAVVGAGRGTNRMVHEGGYLYPVSAFDPGGKVVVAAVSDSGRKYSKEVFERDLRKIQ